MDAATFSILFRIMLPLSKPVLAVIGLYTAVNHWNDWFAGAFYMTSDKLWPVQTVLQQMLSRAMSASSQQTENITAAIAASQSTRDQRCFEDGGSSHNHRADTLRISFRAEVLCKGHA